MWRNLYQMENFVSQDKPLAMEMFPVNKNRGQPYGYALYQPQVTLEAGQFTIDGLDKALSGRANIFVNQENKVSQVQLPVNRDFKEELLTINVLPLTCLVPIYEHPWKPRHSGVTDVNRYRQIKCFNFDGKFWSNKLQKVERCLHWSHRSRRRQRKL